MTSISFSAAHSKGFWYKFSAMTVPEKGPGGGVIGFCTPVVKFCARIRASSPLRGEGIYLSGGPPHSAPGPVGREPRKGVLPGAGRVNRAGMHVQPQNAAGGHVARCGCGCAVQHRQKEAHTHCCADRCDTRRWPHVLSCACIAAQSRAAMVRRLSVWTNRASVSPLIAISV